MSEENEMTAEIPEHLRHIEFKPWHFWSNKYNGKTSYMEGKGLSRRITVNEIKKEMEDCPTTIKKVEDDVLKVHGEEGVIELVKDYESNCL